MDSFEAQLKCFAMPFLQARDFQSGKNSFLLLKTKKMELTRLEDYKYSRDAIVKRQKTVKKR